MRQEQARWERERRREDRFDRHKKDEELNGVRLQLRDQAAEFATKDALVALERTLRAELGAAINQLNSQGTEGFRESAAADKVREDIAAQLGIAFAHPVQK